jgi:GntR family transcriptional repressor for pyruvate dehydrogenase complex
MKTATTSSVLPKDALLALKRIRVLIESGELGSQSRLPPEQELASDLRMDPESVRAALEKLEAEGLIWRGVSVDAGERVARIDRDGGLHPSYDPMQIIEARLCIEPTLAALCAQRATSDEVSELMTLVAKAEQEPDNDTWDTSLHRTIATLARSSALQAAFAVVDDARASPSWQVALSRARTADHRAMYRKQHMAIVDAVCDRNPSAARWAMTEHLDLVKRHMAVALGPR